MTTNLMCPVLPKVFVGLKHGRSSSRQQQEKQQSPQNMLPMYFNLQIIYR